MRHRTATRVVSNPVVVLALTNVRISGTHDHIVVFDELNMILMMQPQVALCICRQDRIFTMQKREAGASIRQVDDDRRRMGHTIGDMDKINGSGLES